MEIWGKMGKVELLPTRDCEAGYGPDNFAMLPAPLTAYNWQKWKKSIPRMFLP